MKKLLIITLVTAVGMGSSLQALKAPKVQKAATKALAGAKQTQTTLAKKTGKLGTQAGRAAYGSVQPARRLLQAGGYVKPIGITDPKKMQKMIRNLQRKIKKAQKQSEKYISDRISAANKGNKARVRALNEQISRKYAKINRYRRQLKQYTMHLANLKKKEAAKRKK